MGRDEAANEPDDPESGNGVTAADAPGWTDDHWLGSWRARGLVAFDVALAVALAAAVIVLFGASFFDNVALTVGVSTTDGGVILDFGMAAAEGSAATGIEATPSSVLVVTLLGAVGYVFTALYRELDRTAGKVFELNFRLPGAIPIAIGVFLLSSSILEGGGIGVLGLAFLAGLYVNLAYERFGALADNFLPADGDEGEGEDADGNRDRSR